jgi:Flp pilus assembly protein TadB
MFATAYLTTLGTLVLCGCGVLYLIGALWIRKLVQVVV